MNDQRVLAVMYHYVRDRCGTPEEGIRGLDTASFARQLDLLCAHLEPVGWPRLRAWQQKDASIPEACFLLTFDDGLADHAEVVAPILEARGLTGVFFVSGGSLETGRMHAAHQIHLLQTVLEEDALATAVYDWLARNESAEDWPQAVDREAARRLYHYESSERADLKYLLHCTLPVCSRNRMLDELVEQQVSDPRELARKWYLDGSALFALNAAGHTIGGHGFTHEPQARLSPREQLRDLSRSAAVLRSLLGPGERPLSYPFGSYNADVARHAAEVGFVQAFTTRPGWIRQGDRAFELHRVDTIAVDTFLEQELLCPLP